MAAIKLSRIISSLEKKGFVKYKSKKHHLYYYFYYNGKQTDIYTKFSHSGQDYGDELLAAIKRQLIILNQEFCNNFLKCSVSESEYIDYLKDKGEI